MAALYEPSCEASVASTPCCSTQAIQPTAAASSSDVQPGPQPGSAPVLLAVAARVRGSAAGMEPPEGARLVDGWYAYAPAIERPGLLRLTRSEFTPDFERCVQGVCEPLARWLPSDGGVTLLQACERS